MPVEVGGRRASEDISFDSAFPFVIARARASIPTRSSRATRSNSGPTCPTSRKPEKPDDAEGYRRQGGQRRQTAQTARHTRSARRGRDDEPRRKRNTEGTNDRRALSSSAQRQPSASAAARGSPSWWDGGGQVRRRRRRPMGKYSSGVEAPRLSLRGRVRAQPSRGTAGCERLAAGVGSLPARIAFFEPATRPVQLAEALRCRDSLVADAARRCAPSAPCRAS